MSRFSGVFFWRVGGWSFVILLWFLKGVSGKVGVWLWWLDGEFVVECVAEMDARQCTFRRRKMRHDFQFYFFDSAVVSQVGERWLPVEKEYSALVIGFDLVFEQ
jgi:hypothetical protein